MKKLLMNFVDNVLSKEQMKNLKGGDYYCYMTITYPNGDEQTSTIACSEGVDQYGTYYNSCEGYNPCDGAIEAGYNCITSC